MHRSAVRTVVLSAVGAAAALGFVRTESAATAVDEPAGVVFELGGTFTQVMTHPYFFTGTSIHSPDNRVLMETRPIRTELSFKNSDGILNQIKEGMGGVLRIDCDNLGNGREVKTEIRLQDQRNWEEGVAAFRNLEPFSEVCG